MHLVIGQGQNRTANGTAQTHCTFMHTPRKVYLFIRNIVLGHTCVSANNNTSMLVLTTSLFSVKIRTISGALWGHPSYRKLHVSITLLPAVVVSSVDVLS